MAGTRTLKVEILGDAKGLGAALGDADTHLGRFGAGIKTAAKTAGLALVGIGFAAAKLGPSILSAGAELEALGKKSATVFEDALPFVKQWSRDTAAAMGMTADQATGVAAGIADLLKPMGFASGEAAAMSMKMLDLSGALSAWSGGTKSATEVAEIMTSAMLGETDGLKALGISISAADVEARLALKGQQDLTGAAKEQAEALAVQELIFEKSTDAQKAWADGSMDAIKSQNEMKAALEKLKESVVKALYPVVSKLVPLLQSGFEFASKAVSSFFGAFANPGDGLTQFSGIGMTFEKIGIKAREMWDAAYPVIVAVFKWLGEFIPNAARTFGEFVTGAFEGGKRVVTDLAEAFGTSEGTIVKVLAGITAGLIGLAVAWNMGPGLIVTGIVALVAGFLWAYENVEGFREGVQTAFRWVKAAFDGVTSAASWLWAALQGVWDKAEGVRGFFADAFSLAVGAIKLQIDLLTAAFGLVAGAVQTVWDKTETLREFLGNAFKLGLEAAAGAIGVIVAAFEKVFGWLESIIGAAKTAVEWIGKVLQADLTGKVNPNIGQPKAGGIPGARSAFGNALRAGEATLVGERGRSEVFVPSVDGSVLPSLSGDTYIFQTGAIISERQLTDIVHDGLLRKQRSTALRLA